MSKSKGNVVDPFSVLDRFGADALRWYFFSSKQPWDGYRFSEETIAEGVRLFLNTLWNTYGFLVLYENAAAEAPPTRAPGQPTDLDRWVLSRLSATVTAVTERLDAFDATTGAREIATFVDDLSNWYVRRSRRRFWDGDARAFATLRECLVTVAQLLAPFTPFVADEIYDNLDGTLGVGAPHRLAGGRPARRRAGGRDGDRARGGRAGPARPRGREGRPAPAAARGGRRGRGPRARRRWRRWPTSSARSSTSRRCASSTRPTSWGPTTSSPTTARSARASARRCRRSRPRSRRSTPTTSPWRCARAGSSASPSTATTTTLAEATC